MFNSFTADLTIRTTNGCVEHKNAVLNAVSVSRCLDTAKRKLPMILACYNIKNPNNCELSVYEKNNNSTVLHGVYSLT